jgi:glycosyltransferase involved in cell wall biosynthesis
MSISIIIPVAPQFQHASKYLMRCLASVVWQLAPLDEIIIEGGSESILRGAALPLLGDSHIRFLPELPNRGISASRNRAIRASTGEWIKFLDCDDLLAPFALDQFRALNIQPHLQLITGPQIKVVNGVPRHETTRERPCMNAIHTYNPTLPSMTFVRRSAFDAVGGFNEGIHFEEDWDFWLRLRRVFGLGCFGTVGFPICYYWIDEQERQDKTADHTVECQGERLDVREYFRREYGVHPPVAD